MDRSGGDAVSGLRRFVPGAFALAIACAFVALFWEWSQERAREHSIQNELRKIQRLSPRRDENVLLRVIPPRVAGPLLKLAMRIPGMPTVEAGLREAGMSWSLGSFLLISLGCAIAFGLVTGGAGHMGRTLNPLRASRRVDVTVLAIHPGPRMGSLRPGGEQLGLIGLICRTVVLLNRQLACGLWMVTAVARCKVASWVEQGRGEIRTLGVFDQEIFVQRAVVVVLVAAR